MKVSVKIIAPLLLIAAAGASQAQIVGAVSPYPLNPAFNPLHLALVYKRAARMATLQEALHDHVSFQMGTGPLTPDLKAMLYGFGGDDVSEREPAVELRPEPTLAGLMHLVSSPAASATLPGLSMPGMHETWAVMSQSRLWAVHESEQLKSSVADLLDGQRTVYAVAYKDLTTGECFFLNARDRMHAASTMKIPVMMAIFEMIDQGELSLDAKIPIHNRFKSLVNGETFSVQVDHDHILHRSIGKRKKLEKLLELMIVRSSNLAANILVDIAGIDRIDDLMRRLGAYNTRIRRGVEDRRAYAAGLNNETDAFDMLNLMIACRNSKLFSESSRERMIEILRGQEINDMIPAGIPKRQGVLVAHKTGRISRVQHDAALIDLPNGHSYALVILSRDFGSNRWRALETGRRVSRLIYDHAAAL